MREDRKDGVVASWGEADPRPPPARGGRRGRATRRLDPSAPCLNCGDPTPGEYCPSCGQRKADVQVSIRAMVADLLEDELTVDRRLPATLRPLFFKPGQLTVDYVNGRIARYIRPFRLYLVSSVIFFVVLSLFSLRFIREAVALTEPSVAADTVSLADPATADETAVDTAPAAPDDPRPSPDAGDRTMAFLSDVNLNLGHPALDSAAAAKLRQLSRMERGEAAERVVGDFLRYGSWVMFVLLPLFALVLKVLYIRRRRFYAEHFIFLLHTHAFVFLVFTVLLLLVMVGWSRGWVVAALHAWIAAYVYLAMRRVYGQGHFKTAVKWWTLGWVYFWMLTFAIPIAFMATVLLA
jgi:hypothetical protein